MQLAPVPSNHRQNGWQWILGFGMILSIAAVFVALWSMQPKVRLAVSDPLAEAKVGQAIGTDAKPSPPVAAVCVLALGVFLTVTTVPLFLSTLDRESAMLVGFCAVVIAFGLGLGGYLSPISHKAFSKLMEEGAQFGSNDYMVYCGFFYLLSLIVSSGAGVLMSFSNGN